MHEIIYPYFNRDRILKIQTLENLRDFPRDVLDVYSEDLSDGIVCGLTPQIDKEIITFSKGIVKYKGELYVINNTPTIDYGVTEIEVLIKLNFYDEKKDKDYKTRLMEITIDKDLEIKENQIEIGRFKLKAGAYLRSDYQDLYDFTTEYNTINVVHVLYAGYKEPTLSHLILKYFAKEALETRTQNVMDINFCMMALNSGRVERDVILNYIAYKLEEELKPSSNEELHDSLVEVLKVIKRENSGLKRRRVADKKIILD
ncbi:MAG: hypothetical protein FWD82_09460 [Defluviitaleaceae bacterium]|nr:hypothetical protein [Defluviitaleaceae bacterium]